MQYGSTGPLTYHCMSQGIKTRAQELMQYQNITGSGAKGKEGLHIQEEVDRIP